MTYTELAQALTATGYDYDLVMYRMQLWEALKMYEGLIYRDRHLLDALRINALMSIQPYTSEPMTTRDIAVYPWDGEVERGQVPEDVDIEKLKQSSREVSLQINNS